MLRTIVLASLAVAAPAYASPSTAGRAAARQHYDSAVTHYNVGEFAEAALEFREVYKAAPQPELLYDAAQAYRLAKDRTQAAFFYQSYLRADPATPHREEVERRIRDLAEAKPAATTAIDKPVDKPEATPSEKPAEKPATKPTDQANAEKTPQKPLDKPAADKTADRSGGSERLRPVTDLIKKNRGGFRACFDAWSKNHPGGGGAVSLTFYLDPDGNLDQADAEAKGFEAPEVERCVIAFARTLRYPASPSGKFTRFTYPFDFKPSR